MLKMVGDQLDLPEDCDDWGRLAYEKEDKERAKKERAERKKRERQEDEKEKEREARDRNKEERKGSTWPGPWEESKRERSRSRILKSMARPQDQDEAEKFLGKMTEVDLRRLCQGLKSCGMLEGGINYLYMEGAPMEQAKKAIRVLQLGAKTIASLSGVEYKKVSESDAASSMPPEPAGPPPAKKSPEKSVAETDEQKVEAQKRKMRESLKEAKGRREEAEDSLSASYSEKDDEFEEMDDEYEGGPPREGTVVLRERGQGWGWWRIRPRMEWLEWRRIWIWIPWIWPGKIPKAKQGIWERQRKGQRQVQNIQRKIGREERKESEVVSATENLQGPFDAEAPQERGSPPGRVARNASEPIDMGDTTVWKRRRNRVSQMLYQKASKKHQHERPSRVPSLEEVKRDVTKHRRSLGWVRAWLAGTWRWRIRRRQASDTSTCLPHTGQLHCRRWSREEATETGRSETGRRGDEERTRQYDSLGNVLNAFYANSCSNGVAQMVIEDDLLRSCFTKDGNTTERYMALAAVAGTGDLTGRKCKTWTKLNEKSLGALICLGCKTVLTPAGLEVMDDQKSPEKMMKKLDAEYYPQATVVVDEEADSERMKEVILTLNTKGGSLTVVTTRCFEPWDWNHGVDQEISVSMEKQTGWRNGQKR